MLTITYITMLRLILICSTVKFVGFYGQWGMVWDGGQSMFGFRHERDDHNPHSMGPSRYKKRFLANRQVRPRPGNHQHGVFPSLGMFS